MQQAIYSVHVFLLDKKNASTSIECTLFILEFMHILWFNEAYFMWYPKIWI